MTFLDLFPEAVAVPGWGRLLWEGEELMPTMKEAVTKRMHDVAAVDDGRRLREDSFPF